MQGMLTDLDRRLRSDGYRPGSPSAEVAAADAGVCAQIACRRCRLFGLDYRPYVRTPSGRDVPYRPLAVCRLCGQAEEF